MDAVAGFYVDALAPLAVDLIEILDDETRATFIQAVASLAVVKPSLTLSDLRRLASGVTNPRST